jgi:hypothetical protein
LLLAFCRLFGLLFQALKVMARTPNKF